MALNKVEICGVVIVCPFLLSSKNKSKKYWNVLDFFIILRCENEKSSLTK